MNLSSIDTINNIKNRRQSTFSYLYLQYNKILIRGAMKRGLAFDQAEVVAQDVWSDFYENAHNFKGQSHVTTYLYGIMKNKCYESFRSNLKYTKNDIDEGSLIGENTEQIAINKDTLNKIKQELKQLTQRQSTIFLQKELHGFTPKELSIQYELLPNHISIISHRVKQIVKNQLIEVA